MRIENSKITLRIDSDQTVIEIFDSDASTTIAKAILTPQQLSQVLSRLAYVDCECMVGDFSRIGKKMENQTFEFEITGSKSSIDLNNDCIDALFREGMSDWIPDNYYQSQNSFFNKDDKQYARVTIRRWV